MIGQETAQKVEVVFAPFDDLLEIVAPPIVPQTIRSSTSGNGWATRQPSRSSSIAAKWSKSTRKRGLSAKSSMAAVSESPPQWNQAKRNPKTAVNPSSGP
jgi:hypothetical protein